MLWPPLRVRFLYGTQYFNTGCWMGHDIGLPWDRAKARSDARFLSSSYSLVSQNNE